MLRISSSLLALASLSTVAFAQGDPAGATAPADPAAGAPAVPGDPAAAPTPPNDMSATGGAPVAPAPMESEGTGLRNGFAASVGYLSGQQIMIDRAGMMFGLDWRIGWKFTKPISAYLNTHFSVGSVSGGGAASKTIGNLEAAVLGEYELPMRLFFAGGGGYGMLQDGNADGLMLHFRAGYYPFETKAVGKARRLNVALDGRFFLPGGVNSTFTMFGLTVGYDRF
jgi:hypothetical protein